MSIPKRIKKKNDHTNSSGGYGFYFNYNKKYGVKVLNNRCYNIKDIIDEYIAMKICEKSGITPKVYGFTVVHIGKRKKLAIVMEHKKGKTLEELDNNYRMDVGIMSDYLEKYFEPLFTSLGIELWDWNISNIMVREGFSLHKIANNSKKGFNKKLLIKYVNNFIRIDFTPEHLNFNNSKKYHEYYVKAAYEVEKLGFKIKDEIL